MASAMRKMAVYLGLVEDDHRYQDKYDSYAEYEDYDDQADQPEQAASLGRVAAGMTSSATAADCARAGVADDRARQDHDTASSHLQ